MIGELIKSDFSYLIGLVSLLLTKMRYLNEFFSRESLRDRDRDERFSSGRLGSIFNDRIGPGNFSLKTFC